MERVSLFFLWLAVLLVPTHNIHGNPANDEEADRAKTFSVFEENGKVGLKDEEGQILIPANYDAIGWSNGQLSIIDKVVGYRSNGLWGLIHTSNKIVTPPEFQELKPGEGSFLVAQKRSSLSQRSSYGVVTTAGKTVIPFQYDGLNLSNMRAIVMSRTGMRYNFGLIDLSERVLIPMDYQRIYSLGSLRYAVENFGNKTAIFSDEGKQITAFNIDSISVFRKDYAIVYQNQRQGLIDRNGQLVLEPAYGDIQLDVNGGIRVRDIDSWFLLDGENNLLGKYEADAIRPLSEKHYAVVSSGKLRLTTNEFQPLHESYFSSLSDFRDGLATYRYAARTGVINTRGEIVIPAEYQQIILDKHGFRARLDAGFRNRWVILDAQGKTVTEKHYQDIAPFNGKFYPVRNRGYWGALDSSGKEIITCVHDSLIQHKDNNVVVKFKGEYGVINLNENWVVTPQENPLELVDGERYFEYAGKTTFLRSFTGEIIYFSDNHLEPFRNHIREHLPSGAYWVIDMNGIITDRSSQPDRTEKIFAESEGLRAIFKDGKYGFIDDAGRLRIANRYEDVKPFSGGLAAIRIRNRWGFIDHEEKLLVQPVYDQVEDFGNGYSIVRQENASGLIDGSGKVVLPIRYDEITRTDQNRFILRQGRSVGLADGSGAIIIHPKYDDLTDTGNGYVIVHRNGKFGVLTLSGISTIPMIYDGLSYDPYHKHYLGVKRSAWKNVNNPSSVVRGPQ